MENVYFDRWEFLHAVELFEKDPIETKNRLEVYIENYPFDYSAYEYLIALLTVFGELETAEMMLNNLEKMILEDINYNSYEDKMIRRRNNIILARIKLLSYQERYDELYRLVNKEYDMLKMQELTHIAFYSKMKVGKVDKSRRCPNSYIYRQIVEYMEDDFFEHVRIRHIDNQDPNEKDKAIFAKDFPLKEVFEEIKKYVPSDKKMNCTLYDNVYVFKYENCGRVGNKVTSYFKVVTLNNSSDFLTMYPSLDSDCLPNIIDLNYMIKKKEEIKVLSRIDKFNRRYNIK